MTQGATAPAQGERRAVGGGGGGQRHPAAAPLGNLEEGFLPCSDPFLDESLYDTACQAQSCIAGCSLPQILT